MKPAIHQPARNFPKRAWWAAAVCAVSLCTNPSGRAATSTNRLPAQGPEDRFLLIVDTSAAMERNAENTQRAVSQLLSTGMVGQARPGDTIGLWTFGEELQTGVFPLQRWTPQTRQKLAAAATNFMAKIRYEKKSRFEKVVETMMSVVRDSERITVIILTDGTGKISGTPFDEQINESYRLNYPAQRKQRMPLMTVLRAKHGEFTGWRVNTPPFRPEFPAYPVEPKSAEPPLEVTEKMPEPKTEPKPEPKPPPVPPLIVVGEPPGPTSTPTNVPAAEPTVPAAPQKSAASDSPAQPKPEIQPTSPAEPPVSQIALATGAPVVIKLSPPPRAESQPAVTAAVTTATAAVVPKPRTESPPSVNGTPPPAEPKPTEPKTALAPSQGPPATEPPAEATTVQTAVATPSDSWFNRTNLLIAGAVLLVAAFGLFYLLLRRAARPAESGSLITRSMDHDQK